MPSFRCDAPGCVRGVVRVGDFGAPCDFCAGRGEVQLAELARKLGETPQILTRLGKPKRRMRATTCYRIFKKLMAVLQPKQPGLFA
jgi:hypothetical protein